MPCPGLATSDWAAGFDGVRGEPTYRYQICRRSAEKVPNDIGAKTVQSGGASLFFALTVSCNTTPFYTREAAVDRIRPQDRHQNDYLSYVPKGKVRYCKRDYTSHTRSAPCFSLGAL